MFTFLRVPWAKTCMEVVNVAEKKITSVSQELGASASVDKSYQALVSGFEKALKIELAEEELTSHEKALTDKLCREKFSTREWNFEGKQAYVK